MGSTRIHVAGVSDIFIDDVAGFGTDGFVETAVTRDEPGPVAAVEVGRISFPGGAPPPTNGGTMTIDWRVSASNIASGERAAWLDRAALVRAGAVVVDIGGNPPPFSAAPTFSTGVDSASWRFIISWDPATNEVVFSVQGALHMTIAWAASVVVTVASDSQAS